MLAAVQFLSVESAEFLVFFAGQASQFFAEARLVQQIANANAVARHLVFVRRADAARSGADASRASGRLSGFFHLAVQRQDHMRAIADVQPPCHVDPGLLERIDLADQGRRIDHHSGTDHGVPSRPQDAARNQLQHEALVVENYGVAGIVARRRSAPRSRTRRPHSPQSCPCPRRPTARLRLQSTSSRTNLSSSHPFRPHPAPVHHTSYGEKPPRRDELSYPPSRAKARTGARLVMTAIGGDLLSLAHTPGNLCKKAATSGRHGTYM